MQAASGAGQAAMDELEQQTREVLAGQPVTTEIFPFQVPYPPPPPFPTLTLECSRLPSGACALSGCSVSAFPELLHRSISMLY